MNEIIVVVVLVAEILTVLQCLQIAFMQELKFDKYMAIIIGADILLYSAITFGMIPKIYSVLFYILVFLYCYFKFKQKLAKTVIGYIIGLSLGGCIEAIVACGTNLFKDFLDSWIRLLVSSLFALLFVYIIRKCIPLLKVKKINKNSRWTLCCAIAYLLAYGCIVVEYYMNTIFIKVYAIFILLFLVVIAYYLYRLLQAQTEIERKNHELELQNIYGGMYEDLLNEVRRRQHDYKNQLSAVQSMHMVMDMDTREKLIGMQSEYVDELQVIQKYDSILTKCNNPILAGYLYYRCLMCEEIGILVVYDIAIRQAECCFSLHEIIEMLGILIDNACEKVMEREDDNKRISIVFLESNEGISISVSNPAEHLTYAEIDRLFEVGYSSKGKNRGLGLARCLELIQKYNADIAVLNFQQYGYNWVKFEIKIEK